MRFPWQTAWNCAGQLQASLAGAAVHAAAGAVHAGAAVHAAAVHAAAAGVVHAAAVHFGAAVGGADALAPRG